MKSSALAKWIVSREGLYYLILAALLIVVLPLFLDPFRLNMVGKYLTYAFVAIGLALCWGAAASSASGRASSSGSAATAWRCSSSSKPRRPRTPRSSPPPGSPTSWTGTRSPNCRPGGSRSNSLFFTLFAVVAVPVIFAFIISFAMFTRRVGGVYFAIITQAIAAILTILIIGQQGYTGGVNGITDLQTLNGWDIRTDEARITLYFICVGMLFLCLFVARFVENRKLGRILVAMNAQENRVRFSGYDVAAFKIFVFCLAAAFAGIGGAMFTLLVGFMSPSFIGIVASIEMVIFCALGGRLSILGAVYGALLVNAAKSGFSESFPELWPFAMGALFIGVVLAFPNGLAGLYRSYVMPLEDRLFKRNKAQANSVAKLATAKPEAKKSDNYDAITDTYSPEKS